MTATATIHRWRQDPLSFVREVFKIEPDRWQEKALRTLAAGRVNRLCMRACAGPGKTAVLAWIGWWFMMCFAEKGQHPKGIAVGITEDNLKQNLWPEFAKWQQRSPLLEAAFAWQAERIYARDHPETWFLAARSFAKSADALTQGSTLSGLHSRYPFILLDESGNMSPAIGRAAEQAMGGCETGLIVQAGNTTSLQGLLYDSSVRNASSWTTISITADPDDPDRTPRVATEWAADQIKRYGRDNPWVMSYILGQFPPGDSNALLSLIDVETAMGRIIKPESLRGSPRILGLDVARFKDRTVLIARQGRGMFKPLIMRSADTMEIAGRVAKAYREWNAHAVMIDDTGGYGSGVVDQLTRAGMRVFPINFASKADSEQYLNKRSEMWFELAEWIKTGGALPDVAEFKQELTEPTYYFQNSKFRMEEKDQIIKRLGFSPDIADAAALTFAVPIMISKDEMIEEFSTIPGGIELAQGLQRSSFKTYTGDDNGYHT